MVFDTENLTELKSHGLKTNDCDSKPASSFIIALFMFGVFMQLELIA